MKREYVIVKDDFDGENVCEACPKLKTEGVCSVYTPEGMTFRTRMGHCPVSDRWANWREDKPIYDKSGKKRVGQGKTRSGGNL